jgi:dihydroflavonol-4-reductase
MSSIFLTGGSGLLGNNILREGLLQGHSFTTITRQSSDTKPFDGLDAEILNGDLNNQALIEACVAKSDVVIHAAAHIHIGWKQHEQAMFINRDGTRNIVEAAIKFNKPLVHVSTVNVLAIGHANAPANEDTPGDGQTPSTYVLSKRAAEHEVIEAIKSRSLQASIVYPGFMLGEHDWKPSSGRMIVELSKRSPPMSPSGGCSVCDVGEVAKAIVEIVKQQRYGQRYILAGHNVSYFDLWTAIAKRLGKRGPFTILRKPGQIVVGTIADLLSRGKNESDMNSAAIRMGSQFHYYDSSRAVNELNYHIPQFDQILDQAIQWIKQHHL